MITDSIKQEFMEGYNLKTAFPDNARTSNCSNEYELIEEGAAISAGKLEAARKLGIRVAGRENNIAARNLIEMKDSYEQIECDIDEIENILKKFPGGCLLMHPILRAELEKRKKAEWIDRETHSEFYAFGRRLFPVGTIGDNIIIALPEDLPYLDYNGEDIFEEKEGFLVIKREMGIIWPKGEKFIVLKVKGMEE